MVRDRGENYNGITEFGSVSVWFTAVASWDFGWLLDLEGRYHGGSYGEGDGLRVEGLAFLPKSNPDRSVLVCSDYADTAAAERELLASMPAADAVPSLPPESDFEDVVLDLVYDASWGGERLTDAAGFLDVAREAAAGMPRRKTLPDAGKTAEWARGFLGDAAVSVADDRYHSAVVLVPLRRLEEFREALLAFSDAEFTSHMRVELLDVVGDSAQLALREPWA